MTGFYINANAGPLTYNLALSTALRVDGNANGAAATGARLELETIEADGGIPDVGVTGSIVDEEEAAVTVVWPSSSRSNIISLSVEPELSIFKCQR